MATPAPGTIPALTPYQPGALPITGREILEIASSTNAADAVSGSMFLVDIVGKAPSAMPSLNPSTNDLIAFYQRSSGLSFSTPIGNLSIPAGNLPIAGNTGQLLAKVSAVNYDATWTNAASIISAGSGISVSGSTSLVVALASTSGLSVLGVAGAANATSAAIVGAAAQVLRINDAGDALAFGAVNLASTAAVTGVLPGANMSAVNLVASGAGGVQGVLPVGNGGSGTTALTANAVLLGAGAGSVQFATVGTGGRLLIDQGASNPAFTIVAGDVTISLNGTTTIGNNAVTNAKLAQMPASTIKANNSTTTTANAADVAAMDVAAMVNAMYVRMWPSSGQGAGPWNVVDAFGIPVDTSATNTQGLQEALNYAKANGMNLIVSGVGTINCTAALTIPASFNRSLFIDSGIILRFGTLGTASPITVDSAENCYYRLQCQVTQTTGDTGAVVRIKPANAASTGNINVAASYIEFGNAISPAAGATAAIMLDPTAGGIIGNTFRFGDPHGGRVGVLLNNPTLSTVAIQENKFFVDYLHGQTNYGIEVGTGTTNAANLRRNQWFLGRISPNNATAVGFSTWGSYDTISNLNVNAEEGAYATGITLQTTAINNTVNIGQVTGFGTADVSNLGVGNTINNNGFLNSGGFSRVSSNFNSATTALADITGLSATLYTAGTYLFEADIYVTAGSTGGAKVAMACAAGASNVIYDTQVYGAGALVTQSRATALGTSLSATSATTPTFRVVGSITTATTGALTAQIAQVASTTTTTIVLPGSSLKVYQVT